MKRRTFIKTATIAGASTAVFAHTPLSFGQSHHEREKTMNNSGPIILSTWNFKLPVNETAYGVLQNGGSLLDAVEQTLVTVQRPDAAGGQRQDADHGAPAHALPLRFLIGNHAEPSLVFDLSHQLLGLGPKKPATGKEQ